MSMLELDKIREFVRQKNKEGCEVIELPRADFEVYLTGIHHCRIQKTSMLKDYPDHICIPNPATYMHKVFDSIITPKD